MKRVLLNRLIAMVVLGLVSLFAAGTYGTDVIFRPGPGLNDGTDNGSRAAGKDTTLAGCLGYRGDSSSVMALPRSSCNPCNEKGYIQFDVSTLPALVQQVFLSLEEIGTANCYGGNCEANFYFYLVTEDWDEMAVGEGSAAPAEGSAVLGPFSRTSIPPGTPSAHREYDITDIYRGWKDGTIPNHGLAVYSPEGLCNNGAAVFLFYSSDSPTVAYRPALRIVPEAPHITGITLSGGDGKTKAEWKSNGFARDTASDPQNGVLGVSDKANAPLLNNPDTTVDPLPKGNYWLYAEPGVLGTDPKLDVTLSDGGTLSAAFTVSGTAGVSNKWARAFGSPLLSLGWANGGADRVGAGDSMLPSGVKDIFMRMRFFGPTGGSVVGVDSIEVTCENLTNGTSVQFSTTAESWTCETRGLKVDRGDEIRQTHRGNAQ